MHAVPLGAEYGVSEHTRFNKKEQMEAMQASNREAGDTIMHRINRVWLDGKVEDLAPMVHREVVMALPGLGGTIQGRDQLLAGFRDFCENAKVHQFQDYDLQADIPGHTAVITFRYEMVYERADQRYQVTGRELWVFQEQGNERVAVWRTMLDTDEQALLYSTPTVRAQ